MSDEEKNVEHFLNLIRQSRRGKFKVYIGMSAGVGKTFRMLQEAQTLLRNGVDVKIGYIETHGRSETYTLLEGLPVIPRRKLFYKGKELEELDVQAVLNLHPEIVIIDELAHTNIEGSKNEKRWQDVMDILDAGINVISAVNIQHLESLNAEIKEITGVNVTERIPDSVLKQADEVVNIDLTADELITRLREGKIYTTDKIEIATEQFMACITSNHQIASKVIRKTARLASYYNSKWVVLYVQTPKEDGNKIGLAAQRHLINNFKLATELGAEVIRTKNSKIAKGIIEMAEKNEITTICIGKPHLNLLNVIMNTAVFNQLLNKLSEADIDIVILS